ncbi:MAG: lipoate--protein ligase family protein [Bacteroidales bacterium]|nr:lipoate--protein ligase family protein [Bacteroidales bacterium]
MIQVRLPDAKKRGLAFYLAMEEYLAARKDTPECFFLWQVAPTVIIGRNQDLEAEVNLPYCKEHAVDIVRRKSGGGCVYADEGNLMVSYIIPGPGAALDLLTGFVSRMAEALRSLGLDAVPSGRNDVLVAGKKVSGNAFFKLPSCGIAHGTMLYDSDLEAITAAITPSREKLSSKGIKSVRERVTNISEQMRVAGLEAFPDTAAFAEYLAGHFRAGDGTLLLEQSQILEIQEIEKAYING